MFGANMTMNEYTENPTFANLFFFVTGFHGTHVLSGVIINIIGAGGERPMQGYAAGAGGNAALMALTRALGARSTLDGIRVVGINPGLIETERLVTMQRTFAAEQLGDPERWRELLDTDFPPGRPAHIADMVAFLASPLSSNTTGTIITIDGGHCAR